MLESVSMSSLQVWMGTKVTPLFPTRAGNFFNFWLQSTLATMSSGGLDICGSLLSFGEKYWT